MLSNQITNTDPLWKNIKVNKKETYEDQCNQSRRPRIGFDKIKEQLPDKYCKIIFDGNIKELY